MSVVVPFRNAERSLGRCIAALVAQAPPEGDYEVILVDDASGDDSVAIAGHAARVRLLHSPRRGPYAARNHGVQHARGDLIAFTDSDCVVEPEWLHRLAAEFDDPGVAVLVGSRAPARRSRALTLLAAYEEARDATIFAGEDLDLLCGSCNNLAVRRTAFELVGGFVERPRGSDAILVNRVARELGRRAVRYQPAVRVAHLEIDHLRDYYRKVFIYGRSLRSIQTLSRIRQLRSDARVGAWRRTVEDRRLSPADGARLLALLAVSNLVWVAGSVSGRVAPSRQ